MINSIEKYRRQNLRRASLLSEVADQRRHLMPDVNAQGHRHTCVCRTCFEAYLRRGKVVA